MDPSKNKQRGKENRKGNRKSQPNIDTPDLEEPGVAESKDAVVRETDGTGPEGEQQQIYDPQLEEPCIAENCFKHQELLELHQNQQVSTPWGIVTLPTSTESNEAGVREPETNSKEGEQQQIYDPWGIVTSTTDSREKGVVEAFNTLTVQDNPISNENVSEQGVGEGNEFSEDIAAAQTLVFMKNKSSMINDKSNIEGEGSGLTATSLEQNVEGQQLLSQLTKAKDEVEKKKHYSTEILQANQEESELLISLRSKYPNKEQLNEEEGAVGGSWGFSTTQGLGPEDAFTEDLFNKETTQLMNLTFKQKIIVLQRQKMAIDEKRKFNNKSLQDLADKSQRLAQQLKKAENKIDTLEQKRLNLPEKKRSNIPNKYYKNRDSLQLRYDATLDQLGVDKNQKRVWNAVITGTYEDLPRQQTQHDAAKEKEEQDAKHNADQLIQKDEEAKQRQNKIKQRKQNHLDAQRRQKQEAEYRKRQQKVDVKKADTEINQPNVPPAAVATGLIPSNSNPPQPGTQPAAYPSHSDAGLLTITDERALPGCQPCSIQPPPLQPLPQIPTPPIRPQSSNIPLPPIRPPSSHIQAAFVAACATGSIDTSAGFCQEYQPDSYCEFCQKQSDSVPLTQDPRFPQPPDPDYRPASYDDDDIYTAPQGNRNSPDSPDYQLERTDSQNKEPGQNPSASEEKPIINLSLTKDEWNTTINDIRAHGYEAIVDDYIKNIPFDLEKSFRDPSMPRKVSFVEDTPIRRTCRQWDKHEKKLKEEMNCLEHKINHIISSRDMFNKEPILAWSYIHENRFFEEQNLKIGVSSEVFPSSESENHRNKAKSNSVNSLGIFGVVFTEIIKLVKRKKFGFAPCSSRNRSAYTRFEGAGYRSNARYNPSDFIDSDLSPSDIFAGITGGMTTYTHSSPSQRELSPLDSSDDRSDDYDCSLDKPTPRTPTPPPPRPQDEPPIMQSKHCCCADCWSQRYGRAPTDGRFTD